MRTYLVNILGLDSIHRYFTKWIVQLDRRVSKLEDTMTVWDDALVELSEATDNVAAELDDLKAQLSAGNLSPEDAASALGPFVSRLKAMGTQDQVDPTGGATDPTTTTDPVNSPATEEAAVVDEEGNPVNEVETSDTADSTENRDTGTF